MLKKVVLLAVLIGGSLAVLPPGVAAAETTGTQVFRVVKIGTGPGRVVARGVVTGAGTEESNRFQVPPGSPFQVTFHFRGGDVHMTVVPGPPQVRFNPNSCRTQITLHPTTTITGGTGAYAGATGSGTATSLITIKAGRAEDGTCLGPSSPPIFQMSRVRSSGTLTLP